MLDAGTFQDREPLRSPFVGQFCLQRASISKQHRVAILVFKDKSFIARRLAPLSVRNRN
jgi:hypothetical protein